MWPSKFTLNNHTCLSVVPYFVTNKFVQNLQNQLQLLQKPKPEESVNPGSKEKNVASSSSDSDRVHYGKTE